jgi:hypothetical protein
LTGARTLSSKLSSDAIAALFGTACVFAIPGSFTGACHVSGKLSSDDSVGFLLGDILFTGSPSLPRSNMDIREVVGGIDTESTAVSLALVVLAPPTLPTRLGVLCIGLGLALLLAANVAAMKLGLLVSTRACSRPFPPTLPPCLALYPYVPSISVTVLPPVL